jgi:hypothetical protein
MDANRFKTEKVGSSQLIHGLCKTYFPKRAFVIRVTG